MFEEIRKRGTDDSIIYLAGDIAHAKLELSPELVREISWLFTECSKHCETILITGNHDCNMNNSDRLDVLTPIVEALNLPNFRYLRDTQVYSIGGVDFGVFSILDNKANWPKGNTLTAARKIALFHGPIDNSSTDIGYVVSSRHFTTDIFDGYDLALLGDIHKRQEMISPSGCKVVYAGSLVQQNFGESVSGHGLLVWDLDTLEYEAIDIQNDYGYYTMDVDNGIVPIVSDMPKNPRLRVRLSNTDAADTKKVITEIKMRYGVEDFTIVRTDSFNKTKTGNRLSRLEFENVTDINYQNTLICDYVQRMLPFATPSDLNGLELINRDINSRIKQEEIYRNIQWKPINFSFSNMFSYGEDNIIDFTKVGGLMGLFAPNASGKSSLFDAISFCLFDKCSRAFKATNIMNNRKSEFECKLHLQISGIDYYIKRTARTINKGRNVKVDVEFWKEEDGIITSLNGTERRDTNIVIEQHVGKYDDFVLTALSLQGNNSIFIDKSQSERKELLAQFMGLNIFDKLYETAAEDNKEVSILIRNFKKTDFTSELAEKGLEKQTKKSELRGLEKTLENRTIDVTDLSDRILGLTKELVPVDGNLDLEILEKKKNDIDRDILHSFSEEKLKKVKLDDYAEAISQISKSIEEKKYINEQPIEEAKKEWDVLKGEISNTERYIALVEQSLESNREKLAHLAQHEYDPNCNFCMNNVFVKDAKETEKRVEEQIADLEEVCGKLNSLINQASRLVDVDEQWDALVDLKSEYQTAIFGRGNTIAELNVFRTQQQLYDNQLEQVKADIQKYHDNEDTIKRNKQIESVIDGLNKTKSEIESEIKSINKQITTITGLISSLVLYIDGVKQKMDEVKELEEKNRLYTYYLDAVKRDGIPYELIWKATPVIENEINNILSQVVDFGIVLDIDGKSINAKIVYDSQEWPLEMCSGMEKFISGLAIRVALNNICNLPRPNFLVIDEGFGTLDASNLSSLFMMMQYLKTQYDFIWIISHLEQMRDVVDGLIEIKKINGFSKIVF
jgi:DNA repair exonuclease SbcCD ATPase subunit